MLGDIALTDALREHAFLAGLPADQLRELSAIARSVDFAENELILMTAQQSRRFYLLLSGSVCVEFRTRAYSVRIQTLSAGEAFGWSALLDHHDTLFQVRAQEQSTALSLDSDELALLLERNPVLAAGIYRRALQLVAGRVQATETKLGELCGVKIPRLG